MTSIATQGMINGFNAALAERGIVADSAQQFAAARLQKFYDELVGFKAARSSALKKLLARPELPRGVWFWGGVGRGKSFLMDCFYAAVPYTRKRRVHFHAFMQEVHGLLQTHRHQSDPLAQVAAHIAKQTRLMCFDEFHVSDIADAMILGRLMEALFNAGVLFCITSNYPPAKLYPNGLHRQRFLPTIALLEEKLDVIELDAGIDYRMRTLVQAKTFLVPTNATTLGEMESIFKHLAGGEGHSRSLEILGRDIPVIARAPGVAWFDFATLCGGPRSQNDYLEIADRHRTVFVSDIPKMNAAMANEARRFTWLIDVLYDHRVTLIASAACPIEQLYLVGPQASEFRRTESRLVEMGSHDYLTSAHRRQLEMYGDGSATISPPPLV
ncbi:MAG: AFG1 family ATPase [Rhodocyclaceae bacterium]|nr:AFG1 family ATPase [Rhodocyclaceae bacterium]MBP6278972.1 AFG1 family ATPase [Rhodocyclaceae bacterium]